MRILLLTAATVAFSTVSGLACAQSSSQPGVVTSGAAGVFINGKPMVREGDQTSGCAN
ncbi:hypothetical protein MTX26_17075 [Bradyrhizobium sp. ISRA443]|uniref:PAAR domain-containing protein n=1 Tax=unclassified Bradyrhizobium TaxID=2631580 RepID=UPI00247AE71E|nr:MULTISPECIES: PAAR domain-containing protein [unclassified Bradyrhizobium]WGR92007.1 hypothetical protein MTX20_27670 [Bradyrhizobium sp. ISRA435]WGS02432.1 hypothetical protein MTX23_17085 [Bradyrhizobium sp. ISRA436]WGS09317.1 hypothetical protein MTX18_17075 [Bradyrhizobium sp. ISRA437]WGS16206.1 hypothetical protein MTX26_17075 [Bradyrhizobium sp. ISRA443]